MKLDRSKPYGEQQNTGHWLGLSRNTGDLINSGAVKLDYENK